MITFLKPKYRMHVTTEERLAIVEKRLSDLAHLYYEKGKRGNSLSPITLNKKVTFLSSLIHRIITEEVV